MFLRIESAPKRLLIGQFIRMSYAENQTFKLWNTFMPRRFEIKNNVSEEYISLQKFDDGFDMRMFTPNTIFEKWACKEVEDLKVVPSGMETLILEEGKYAVFLHKGLASDFRKTMNFIYQEWLPSSDYKRDARPNFEILGEKYKRDDATSEEEVWIPIKPT